VIVLSGNIDKEFRKNMLKKKIIDYVNKQGVDDIKYIINTIKRLQKNKDHKILVVDDSMVFRKQMDSILKTLFFKVITVAHGEEALNILKDNPDISLVITDYNMPVMDGLELTKEIRKKYTKDDISIIALSSNADDDVNAMFLKSGANDYIKKPFLKEEFSCRINNSIESLENIHLITNQANRDYLTGLYNRRYFFDHMSSYISKVKHETYAVAMIDIDFFKKVNDVYGHETGDKVIVLLSEVLRTSTNHNDIVARFGGEEFCVVLKNINRYSATDIFERIRRSVEATTVIAESEERFNITISIGFVMSEDIPLEELIAEADMNLYKAKEGGRNQVISG
jgi:diguanylate cyclase (GGDEF)-like protein